METLFRSGGRGEDLLQWCQNLDALGDIMCCMAGHEDGDECFGRTGESLGSIISDYAGMINETVSEIVWDINGLFEYDYTLKTCELKRKVARLKKKKSLGLEVPLGVIDKVSREFKQTLDEAIELNSTLIRMREEAVNQLHKTQQERALAQPHSKTRAPENNRQ